MNIYEFVTPSDPITFKTDDNKIAFACSILLGNGKAGCNNITTGDKLNTFLMFSPNPEKDIEAILGCGLSDYLDKNVIKIADCFLSFAYGTPSERKTYDMACEAITDENKLIEFKKKHEDNERTSMSKWVQSAWSIGNSLKKKYEQKA